MSQLSKTILASLCLACTAEASAEVIHREDFEGQDFIGYSTLQNYFAVNGADYFDRGDNLSFTFDQNVTGYSGSNFIGLEDIDGAGFTDPHWLELDPIDITGVTDLGVNFLFAAPNSLQTRYELNDYLVIEYSIDGAGYTVVGHFMGTGITGGYLQHDTNLDGVGDVPVGPAMQRYSYAIPATGSSLKVRVRFSSAGPQEEMAFDDIVVTGTRQTFDADGQLLPSAQVSEPTTLPTTADNLGAAQPLIDFTLADGGSSDAAPLLATAISANVAGTATSDALGKITWLLDGPDVDNQVGTYNSVSNTVNFTNLNISVADAGTETYTIKGYFNNATGITDNHTIQLSLDSQTNITTDSSGTSMQASLSVNNATGSSISVNASRLQFSTQPAGSVSGSALTTQPVVEATDNNGNRDLDFNETITLTEASAGSLTGNTAGAVQGIATFTALSYTATADQESFTLTANDEDGTNTDLPTVDSQSVTSDVVATQLSFSVQPASLVLTNATPTIFATSPVVQAVDSDGLIDTGYSTDITLSAINGGGATELTATGDADGSPATVTLTPNSGQVTFTGLGMTYTAVTTPDTFNLAATSGGLASAISSQLLVNEADTDGDGLLDSEDSFPLAVTEVTSGGVILTTLPSSSDSTCSLQADLNTSAPLSTPPGGLNVHGSGVSFSLADCGQGESVEVTIDFGTALPAGAVAYKVTDTGWTRISEATVSGSKVTYTLQDDGPLDQETSLPGVIRDPVAIAVSATTQAKAIPAMPLWMLGIMAAALSALGWRFNKRNSKA